MLQENEEEDTTHGEAQVLPKCLRPTTVLLYFTEQPQLMMTSVYHQHLLGRVLQYDNFKKLSNHHEHHHNDHQRAMKNDRFFYPELLSELQKMYQKSTSQKYKTTDDRYPTLTLNKRPASFDQRLTPKSRRSR